MIQYRLKCDHGHEFDSWFQSADMFETLNQNGQVECPICGSKTISKSLMAPSVQSRVKIAEQTSQDPGANLAASELQNLQRKIEENSDYVGTNFARDARDMHDGLIPERAIYGEAKPDDARKLVEDGISVLPLPFTPKRKSN